MTATDPSAPAQPATPGQAPYSDEAFRRAKLAMLACNTTLDVAERLADNLLRILARMAGAFPARADELDAAPRTYALPAEPAETTLWDRKGQRWDRDGDDTGRDGYHFWRRQRDGWIEHYPELLAKLYPLSSAPPAGTEGTS